MALAFGIKIITQDYEFSPASSSVWGLYASVDAWHSEFRWIQNNITGLSPEWKSGLIVAQGISNFSVEIDLRNGGVSNLPGSGSVTVKNTSNFKEFLEGRKINLNGLRLEIWELGTGNYQNRIRSYFCFEPEWDNLTFKIPFGGVNENRAANIINIVTSVQFPYASNDTLNTSIPATFGKLIPVVDEDLQKVTRNSIAKFVRTNDLESYRKYTDAFFVDGGYDNTYMFPLHSLWEDRLYPFWLRSTIVGAASVFWLVEPEDTYLKIVDGVGKNQIRQVESLEWLSGEQRVFVRVKDFFETELQADDTDNARSWGQLIEVKRRYDCDHFPCKGFYTSEDEELVTGAEIYVADSDEKLTRVAPYGYDIDKTDDADNKLDIDPLLFDQGNLDSQDSFLILPVDNPHFADDATLENWDSAEADFWKYFVKDVSHDGIYDNDVHLYGSDRHSVFAKTFEDVENCIDKDIDTYTHMYMSIRSQGPAYLIYMMKVLYFNLPKLPPSFTFDKLYICVRLTSETDFSEQINGECPIRIMIRRFKFGVKKIINDFSIDESASVEYNDVPDFYCTNQSSHNEYFFKVIDTVTVKNGHSIFDTDITTKDEYETYLQGGLFFHRRFGYNDLGYPDDSKIYEISFIFKKSSDITKEIYSPMHGRIFSYTWDGRKTQTDLIEKPVDILEHVCRLQSYIDQGVPPVSGWGLQYADLPQIGTSGYGSFDDPDLASQRCYEGAAQIYEYDKGYTDDLKNKICRDFVLANWQDKDGYERVIALPENKITPVYTIQMSDVLDRTKIKVMQLTDDKIITEPYIKYGLNPVTGEYECAMKISNVSAQSYNSKYVDGIHDSVEAAALWRSCHSLYLTTHSITKPSNDQTELTWANGAGGYTIAFNYLKNLINWQFGYEIELPIHYNLCSSWNQCTPVNMLFSHQTDNVSRSALIEKIEVNPNPGYDCTIKAIIYK